MGQNGRPLESENIWHHIFWRIISVSLSIKLLVGAAARVSSAVEMSLASDGM